MNVLTRTLEGLLLISIGEPTLVPGRTFHIRNLAFYLELPIGSLKKERVLQKQMVLVRTLDLQEEPVWNPYF